MDVQKKYLENQAAPLIDDLETIQEFLDKIFVNDAVAMTAATIYKKVKKNLSKSFEEKEFCNAFRASVRVDWLVGVKGVRRAGYKKTDPKQRVVPSKAQLTTTAKSVQNEQWDVQLKLAVNAAQEAGVTPSNVEVVFSGLIDDWNKSMSSSPPVPTQPQAPPVQAPAPQPQAQPPAEQKPLQHKQNPIPPFQPSKKNFCTGCGLSENIGCVCEQKQEGTSTKTEDAA